MKKLKLTRITGIKQEQLRDLLSSDLSLHHQSSVILGVNGHIDIQREWF